MLFTDIVKKTATVGRNNKMIMGWLLSSALYKVGGFYVGIGEPLGEGTSHLMVLEKLKG